MAIVKVAKTTVGHETSKEHRVRRSYSERYLVTVNSLDDTATDVREDLRVPQGGATHPNDVQAICRNVRINRTSKWLYEVDAEYDTFVTDPSQITIEENPLDDPFIFEFTTIHGTRVLQKANDLNGNPKGLVNSAYEPIDAADLVVPYSRTAWRITFNRPSLDAGLTETYLDSVNVAPFYGFGVREAMIYDIGATTQYRNGIGYFAITVEVHFDRNTFDLQTLDQGHREWAPELLPGLPFRFFRVNGGDPDPIPRLLNGNGKELAPGGTPVFNRWKYLKERDFYALVF